MHLQIPRQSIYSIERGDRGLTVFSVQRLLNRTGYPTTEDTIFGQQTEANVKKLQGRLNVVADGIVGPATQRAVCDLICSRQEQTSNLPKKLLISKVLYESGAILNAVNWSVAGGVDCGITQRRIYDEQYNDEAAIKRAFDAVYQVDLSGDRVQELFGIFLSRPGIKGNRELAYRVAVLNHNYPSLADRISRDGISGLSSYYTSTQSWVTNHGLRFPDGSPIRTPLEWGRRYSLGAPNHNEPGQAVKFVSSWG